MNIAQLQRKTMRDLRKFAEEIGAVEFAGLRKNELIKYILEKQAKNKGNIFASGVLEILNDGYGFYLVLMIFMFRTLK